MENCLYKLKKINLEVFYNQEKYEEKSLYFFSKNVKK